MEITIGRMQEEDIPWARQVLSKAWGSEIIVTRGLAHNAIECQGLVARSNDSRVGLLTYHLERDKCEILSLNSLLQNAGVGSSLLKEVESIAHSERCKRIWLVTTNDNLRALLFYQRRGYAIVAVHFDAMDVSRRLKPSIPITGENGIPICDEIELSKQLETAPA
jgi:GNAT superfamily N-acetyltransferase